VGAAGQRRDGTALDPADDETTLVTDNETGPVSVAAKSPRPEPSTIAIAGMSGTFARIASAASLTLS
jgi:hypothetical protein